MTRPSRHAYAPPTGAADHRVVTPVRAPRYVETLQSAGPGAAASGRPVLVTWSPRPAPASSSYPPAALSIASAPACSGGTLAGVGADASEPEGPTLGQTILAAMTGPALVAAVAAGFACFLGTAHLPAVAMPMPHVASHSAAASGANTVTAANGANRATPSTPSLLAATSAALPARAKATPALEDAPANAHAPLRHRARQAAAGR